MVATGLTGSFSPEEKNDNVMQAFVYDDNSPMDDGETNTSEDSINVFADSTNNHSHRFSSEGDDEYDVPAFLRKK